MFATRRRHWYRRAVGVSLPTRSAATAAALALPALLACATHGTWFTARDGVLAVGLAVATVTDLLWKRIFNAVPAGILLAVGGLQLLPDSPWVGVPTPAQSALGLLAAFGVMLLFYLAFRGGEGDVKLLAAVGFAAGPYAGLEAMTFGYLLAAAVAAPLLLAAKCGLATAKTLPMAPFFTAGTLLALGGAP